MRYKQESACFIWRLTDGNVFRVPDICITNLMVARVSRSSVFIHMIFSPIFFEVSRLWDTLFGIIVCIRS